MTFSVHGLAVSRGIAIGRAVLVASSRADVAHYFIDPSNYYVIRIKNISVSNGQQSRNSVDYYNFKKTKEGVLFPFTFDNITFDTIELNLPLDDKLFKPTR